MTNEREPLWSDEQYEAYNLGMATEREHQNALSRLSMAKYEARIAELEARLSQTWQPLPDGEVSSFMYIDNGGKLLGVYAGSEYSDWYATEDLPDDVRLCRLVERAEPQSNGWKSVNESLPEGHAWVLVYADGAINCMGYSPDKGFKDWTGQQVPNVNISEITHWKELQRPTEADNE